MNFPQHTAIVLHGELAHLVFVLGAADRFTALHSGLQFTKSNFRFVKVHGQVLLRVQSFDSAAAPSP
jgi:hypothetical protein